MENNGLIETAYADWEVVESSGLTDRIKENPRTLSVELEPDGFEVAHERELTKSQHETSKRSARLSGYLVLAIIIQTAISFSPTETTLFGSLLIGFAIIVLMVLAMKEIIEYGEI